MPGLHFNQQCNLKAIEAHQAYALLSYEKKNLSGALILNAQVCALLAYASLYVFVGKFRILVLGVVGGFCAEMLFMFITSITYFCSFYS